MKEVNSYEARIFIGLTESYGVLEHGLGEALDLCRNFADEVGLCVTVTPTHFIYKHGGEFGAVVGLINYPRFPKTPEEIRETALELAERLRAAFKQHRVSVWFPDTTVMLGE